MSEELQCITVIGRGTAQTSPDQFNINIGIEASRPTVRESYAQASGAMNAVQQKLLSLGVSRESITSSSLDVRVDTRWQEGLGTVVTGYTVSSTLNVPLRYDQGPEEVLAAVVESGNNSVRINGLTPLVSNPSAAEDAARSAAWADARRAAELYAQLAGRTLGAVHTVMDGNIPAGGPRPMMARAALSTMDATMPIAPGQSEIIIAVQVTWLLV